ncbi:hypothetical protein BJX76DRAFT_320984 [Aspergillus varians]
MYPLRRAACRLLASPGPIPIRSRLTAAHRLVIPRRTFIQSRWTGNEAKSQLDSKNAPATNTTTTATADVLDSSIQAEAKAVEEKEVKRESVDGSDTTATAATTSNVVTDSPAEAEAGKVQTLDEDSHSTNATSTTTTTTNITDDEHNSLSNFDVSQIREAADEEAGGEQPASQMRLTKGEKLELQRQARHEPKETIFIGNLFYDVTAEDLREQMSKYGVVQGVNIIYDSRGISKGYGYVQFDSMASAKRAIEAMHMRIFEGRRVTMYYAQTNMKSLKSSTVPTDTLYIGNMPFEMTDRDLNDLFKDIVNVHDIRVTVDRQTGQFRGYVHAEFTDIESAAIGLEKLSRKIPYGRRLKVHFTLNVRKAQRGFFPVGA